MKNLKLLHSFYAGLTKRAKALCWLAAIAGLLIIVECLAGCSWKF